MSAAAPLSSFLAFRTYKSPSREIRWSSGFAVTTPDDQRPKGAGGQCRRNLALRVRNSGRDLAGQVGHIDDGGRIGRGGREPFEVALCIRRALVSQTRVSPLGVAGLLRRALPLLLRQEVPAIH
jgi:hypothetical protein